VKFVKCQKWKKMLNENVQVCQMEGLHTLPEDRTVRTWLFYYYIFSPLAQSCRHENIEVREMCNEYYCCCYYFYFFIITKELIKVTLSQLLWCYSGAFWCGMAVCSIDWWQKLETNCQLLIWQHVPNLRCRATETAWTKMHTSSAWHNYCQIY